MAKSKHFYIRRTHRYLGVLLGIQFLMWTIGGLYFSWSNMDEIHGDLDRNDPPLLSSNISLVSPTLVLDNIRKVHKIDSVVSIQLIEILGKPVYQVRCVSAMDHSKMAHDHEMPLMNHLADAETGTLRGPLSKEEAVEMARVRFKGEAIVREVTYLTKVDAHHEYRESPLPVYMVTVDHPSRTHIYVASELGVVTKFRNDKWRVFDFLWMLHTMDYQGRDNFGNILLRIFSIFGLVTVFSGFALYFVSSKKFK
jgi:uncharacterized iron-regulated membrane protein